MLFEVMRDSATVCQSDETSGGYPPDILRDMREAGYSFRLDNRPWIPGERRALRRGVEYGKRIAELDGAEQLTL